MLTETLSAPSNYITIGATAISEYVMSYDQISERVTTSFQLLTGAAERFDAGRKEIAKRVAGFVADTSISALLAKDFRLFLTSVEGELAAVIAAVPEIVAGIDDAKPHYTADPEPEVGHIYEDATGWRRLIPGMKVKRTTVVSAPVKSTVRTVSLQKAFLDTKAWNDQLIATILATADRLDQVVEELEEQLVDIKEVVVNADRQIASLGHDEESRTLLARRLYMEEVAKSVRSYLVSISLYRREFSMAATSVRKSMEELPEDDFFNVKSEEDVERIMAEAELQKAS
jgi:hypothetical protein